jgi:hypothetical protein
MHTQFQSIIIAWISEIETAKLINKQTKSLVIILALLTFGLLFKETKLMRFLDLFKIIT